MGFKEFPRPLYSSFGGADMEANKNSSAKQPQITGIRKKEREGN